MSLVKILTPARTRSSIFRRTYSYANPFRMAEKPSTHTAYALRRENPAEPLRRERRAKGYWIEIGQAHIDSDGNVHHIFLDRMPIGGFTGHVYLSPIGVRPPDPETEPARPPGDDAH
jgi:hypothetical protein